MRRASLLVVVVLVAACGSDRPTSFDAGTPLATTSTSSTTTTLATTTTTTRPEVAASVIISGEALPRFGDGPDPAIGMPAPTVSGTDFEGITVEIGSSDSYQVVMFLAHWCPHCQSEVDLLGPWLEASPPPAGIEVLSVSTGVSSDRPNYPPSKWLNGADWPVPVLLDTADGEVAQAFGLNAYPFWVVTDPNGAVLVRTAGSLPLESVEALFENLAGIES